MNLQTAGKPSQSALFFFSKKKIGLSRPGSWLFIARSASCSATLGFKWLVSVCTYVTDFSDFCGYSSHRLHPLFPLVSFQLGFSGIPESDAKTSISYLGERYTLTPFWDPFLSLFSEKVPFFPRRPGDGPISRFSSYHGRLRATLPGGSI